MKSHFTTLTALIGILAAGSTALAQTPLGSGLTYQGQLQMGGSPVNDTADFQFTLWDTDVDGNMIGSVVAINNVSIVDGLFTVELDFGSSVFNGDARWLEIDVASPSGGEFTTLSPRQPLTAAPYALKVPGVDGHSLDSADGSSTDVVFVDNAGHVGIGTDTPNAKLNVVNDTEHVSLLAQATGGGGAIVVVQNGSGRGLSIFANTPLEALLVVNDGSGPAASFFGNVNFTDGNVMATGDVRVFGTVEAAAFVGDGAGLTGISGDDLGNHTATQNIAANGHWLSNDGDSEGVFIDGAGNVGIGEAAPGFPLNFPNTLGDKISLWGTRGNHYGFGIQGSTLQIHTDVSASDIVFGHGESTSMTETMRITGDGTVAATAFVGDGSGLTGISGDDLGDHTATQNIAANGHWLSNDGDNEGVFIDGAGNVGIGTDTPGAKLDVVDDGTDVVLKVTQASGSVTAIVATHLGSGRALNILSSSPDETMLVNNVGGGKAAKFVGDVEFTSGDVSATGTVAADVFQGGVFVGDGSGLSGLGAGSTVDLDNVALLRWDLLNSSFPVGSNPAGLAFDGANIWVANVFSDNVTKLRASDGVEQPGSPFPVGSAPVAVAFDGANIWVTNSNSNNVTKLQASDGAVLGTFAVGSSPQSVAFDGANIWVVNNEGSNVTKLRASDGVILGTFPVGSSPLGVAFDGANIWVANAASNNVTKLQASDGVERPGSPFPVGSAPVAVAFDGANIWVASALGNNVTKLRASDGVNLGTFAVGVLPQSVAFDGANIWVANRDSNNVTKLRASDGVNLGTFPVGHGPQGVAFDGANIWVTNALSDNVTRLSLVK